MLSIVNNYLNITNKDNIVTQKRNSMNQSDNCKCLQSGFPLGVSNSLLWRIYIKEQPELLDQKTNYISRLHQQLVLFP